MRAARLLAALCGLMCAVLAVAAPRTTPLVNVPVELGTPLELNPLPGENLRVSLLTFAPGETYWQRFGHNAILIEHTASGANAVYNYGMFDFFQKNFFLNFARGHMRYRLDVDTLERTLRLYASEGRWVRQQVLDLNAIEKAFLAKFLDHNAQPENAEYRYDYFRDNCSTRVRDALDRAVNGALSASLKAEPVTVTYRHEATRLMRPIVPLALGMDAIMGPAGDVPITRHEQSFVPEVLMQAVDAQRIDGKPLVLESRMLVADSGRFTAPAAPLRWTGLALVLGAALGASLALMGRSATRSASWGFALLATPLMLLAGLGGLFMLAAWTLTEHWSMAANWNLLLFSPLALWLLPTAWRKPGGKADRPSPPKRAVIWLTWALLIGAGLSVLGGQQNAVWVLFWLPIHAGLAAGLLRRVSSPSPDSLARAAATIPAR